MPTLKLTLTAIEKLSAPRTGQVFYRDTEQPGLAVRITPSGKKSYVVDKWDKQKSRVARIAIADVSDLTVHQARRQAQKILGELVNGVNRLDKRREERMRSVTLAEAFSAFLDARKNLSPKTIYDYRRILDTCFADWKSKPFVAITRDMVERRHAKLGESSQSQANLAMRVLRSILNFTRDKYEDTHGSALLVDNPVRRLSSARAWYRIERRQSFIRPHEIAPWFKAVQSLPESRKVVGDYLLLLVLTGLRRSEAARLRWENVDLAARTLTVTQTKNKNDHTLPLSDFLYRMLLARKQCATSPYVFPGPGKHGYLAEPKKAIQEVETLSGIQFTPHDLRRTFATIVNNLETTLSYFSIKRLLNHKTQDVTEGYIQHDVERLRAPMQQVTDFVLGAAGVNQANRK